MIGLEIGKEYTDGWGTAQKVAGTVKGHPEWVWTVQGHWFRQADGRKIAYVLVDQTKPDGARRHVPAARVSNWDLKVG